ncbi:hypothetical protein WJX73_000204 [Symbiochloris irregularis]|uniref:Uncharacterized protein n=1 Tax=Symbiochloris irregularis TaxID=706552 RepID=A0AAW1PRD7_9CHLO
MTLQGWQDQEHEAARMPKSHLNGQDRQTSPAPRQWTHLGQEINALQGIWWDQSSCIKVDLPTRQVERGSVLLWAMASQPRVCAVSRRS